MSHEIIKNIFVTADRRVIVCHAPGNIQPQIFHEEEYEPLTELLRKEGYERLEEEILYLFFLGVWQNDLRHGRAVARAIEQEADGCLRTLETMRSGRIVPTGVYQTFGHLSRTFDGQIAEPIKPRYDYASEIIASGRRSG